MNELDKWSAKAVGAEEIIENMQYGFSFNGRYHEYQWTLSDARCMEIFEAKFELDTYAPAFQDGGKWRATSPQNINGHGETPKEARIACAQAIMEAGK